MGLDMFFRDKTKGTLIQWRKANQIRQWFVDHIDEFNYEDNLGHYEVSKELLEELVDDIDFVLAGGSETVVRAEERIPTSSGFFFGDTEYNKDYFLELKLTRNEVKAILANWNDEMEVYYTEWW